MVLLFMAIRLGEPREEVGELFEVTGLFGFSVGCKKVRSADFCSSYCVT